MFFGSIFRWSLRMRMKRAESMIVPALISRVRG